MKKIILALMLTTLMITSVFAGEAIIGNGTTSASNLPFTGLWDNSWSHFILPGNAIENEIDITKLEFNVYSVNSNYLMNNQIVYMRATTATTVTNAYTASPGANGYTQVFSGSVTWNGTGWQGIDLTTPFPYDGTSNLEIIWENRDGSWLTGYPVFYTTSFTAAGAYKPQDGSFPEVNGTVVDYYPNTRVTWLQEGEPIAPALVLPAHNAINVALDADLNWTNGDNTAYTILYLADNVEFTGATEVNPATSPYSPTLAAGTTYFWKVKAVSLTNIEATSVVRSFTTEFLPITQFPYTEGFEGPWVGSPAAPLGWGQISVSGLNPWQVYTSTPHGGTKCAQGPWASAGGDHLLITPTFDFDAGTTYELKFWLKGSTSAGTNLKVQIASGYTGAESFTNELAYYVAGTNMPTSWSEQTISLSGHSGNQAIAFRLIDTNGYSLYIDDVSIEALLAGTPDAPNLVLPANNVANVALDATLSWTTGASTTSSVLYIAENIGFTGANVIQNATSPYTATLNNSTTYYWKVVAVGPTGVEISSDIRKFTTLFPAITQFPWTESFEGDEPNWTIIDNNDDGDMWDTNYSSNAYEGSETATIYTDYNAGSNDDYLISPQLTLTGNERLKFWYRVQGANEPNDFRVVLSTTGVDPADFTNIILPLTECSNTAYQEETIDLSDYSGNCYFAFHVPPGGLDGWRLYIDYVTVEEIPTGTLVQITPDSHDFGNVLVNNNVTQTFTVANSGVMSAEISEITVPIGYTMTTSETLPMTLEPNNSFTVTVTFSPIAERIYAGNLRVKEIEVGNPFGGQNHDAALTGTGIPVPQGATCADPIPLVFPAVDIAGNTADFYDDYENSWVTPSTSYLSGDDVVYQFTLENSMLLNGTITTTNSWIGALILQEEPNEANPAPVILSKTSSGTTLTYTNEFILAGTYYLIISSYASPQSITYNINLTADALPAPAAATSPSPANNAENRPSALTLGWTNAANTETIDLWFGVAGARDMVKVLDNVTKVNQHEVTGLLPSTTYNWKVVNRNYTGETDPESVITWSFSTVSNPPGITIYNAPADAAIDVAVNGNLTWQTTTGADGYKVYFSEDVNFADVVTPVDQTATTYAYNGEYGTTYYWKVIPYNVVGQPTEGIVTRSFTTMPTPFPDADIVFDGTRVLNQNLPMYAYYNYTMSQSIYYQTELNIEDVAINSISYLYSKNSAWSETIEIFMKHTDKETFATTSDWELTDFTHVYSGSMAVNTTESVVNIALDNPFMYNGTDNLMVMFFATDSECVGNGDNFYSYSVTGNRSLERHTDGTNYYASYPEITGTGTLKAYLPVTGFNCQELTEEPQFMVSAETLTFADQVLNTESAKTLTVSNLGLGDLGITGMNIVGTNVDQFRLTDENSYPLTLGTGESISVSVVYAPTEEGDHTAQLNITDNQSRVVHTVQLVGNAIDTSILLPVIVDFEGTTAIPAVITSTNMLVNSTHGNASNGLYKNMYSYNPDGHVQFNQMRNVEADTELNFDYRTVEYSSYPNNARTMIEGEYIKVLLSTNGVDYTTLTEINSTNQVVSTDFANVSVPLGAYAGQYITVRLEAHKAAEGDYYVDFDNFYFRVPPTTPVAELNIAEHDFATVIVNTTSVAKTVTVTNVGVGVLNINEIALTGVNASDFAFEVDAEASMALATGESLDIAVTFTPTGAGVRSATLVITDDLGARIRVNSRSRNANTVTLTGNGYDATITSLPFTEGFEVNNVQDDEPIGWSQVSENGANNWVINKTNTTYERTPRTGEYNATLRYSNTDWLMRPIQVVGGQAYDVELYVRQNTTTIANATIGIYYGDAATIAAMEEITGQIGLTSGDYQLVSGSFVPATSGIYYVGIKGVVNGSPWYISLDDIAIKDGPTTPVIGISATELDFGTVTVGEFATKPLTISNAGVGSLNITAIEIEGDNAADFTLVMEETLPVTLTAGLTLPIVVKFAPLENGLREATLAITDNLGRTFRLNSVTRPANNDRGENFVTLTGDGYVPPQGSVCSNPLPLVFPAIDVTGDTGDYGNDYDSGWITGGAANTSYMNGDDVVYQFTVATDVLLNGTIVADGTWMGVFIMQDEPSTTTPAQVIHSIGASSGYSVTYTDVAIPAGTYYMIISTWPTPNNVEYTINLTATADLDAPTNVAIATTANGTNLTWDVVTGATSYIVWGCDTPDGEYVELGRTADLYYLSYIEDGEMMKFFKIEASAEPAGNPAKGFGRRN